MFYLAASLIVVGVALYVAAPLGAGLIADRSRAEAEREVERLDRERGLAVQALRELEFDREMGKLSPADYEGLHASLENRALATMALLEKARADERRQARVAPRRIALAKRADTAPPIAPPPVRRVDFAPAPSAQHPRRIKFCPQCGARAEADSNFCGECGVALRTVNRATGWID